MLTKLYYFMHRLAAREDEKNQPSKGYWQNKIRKEALRLCAPTQGRLLEVGCGEGLFLWQLAVLNPRLELWGIDYDANMLARAKEVFLQRKVPRIHLSLQDALNLSLKEGQFDSVVCINVLINFDSLEKVQKLLQAMKRLCKPGGKVIFDFRNSLNLLLIMKYRLAPFYDHTLKGKTLHTFYPKDINKIIKDSGLEIISRFPIGMHPKRYAPIIIIEAQKNAR